MVLEGRHIELDLFSIILLLIASLPLAMLMIVFVRFFVRPETSTGEILMIMTFLYLAILCGIMAIRGKKNEAILAAIQRKKRIELEEEKRMEPQLAAIMRGQKSFLREKDEEHEVQGYTPKGTFKREPVSNQLKQEVWIRDNFTCKYCKETINHVVLEVDHIMPVSKGGRSVKSNLQTLCVSCNRKKSNK